MATIITNRATVSYSFGTAFASAVSNITTAKLNAALSITKIALSETYRIGSELTYIITVTNNSSTQTNALSVTDDLGTGSIDCSELTPLTLIGNARLFINGAFAEEIVPIYVDRSVIFNIGHIPANAAAQIIYTAEVNNLAGCCSECTITNRACVRFVCDCPCAETVCAECTVTAEDYAELRIIKSVCPNSLVCGERIRYLIDVYNYGNIEATDVVLTDSFDPALSDLEVRIGGILIPADEYVYSDGNLTLPSLNGRALTVPAAICERGEDCRYSVTPSEISIEISGTV